MTEPMTLEQAEERARTLDREADLINAARANCDQVARRVALGNLRLRINWALADCRCHRRWMREEAAHGRGVMVKSAPSWRWCLRDDQRNLLDLRRQRATLAGVRS